MGRRRRGKNAQAGATENSDPASDPVSRHITCNGTQIALAVGPCWRIIDTASNQVRHVESGPEHAVRAVQFSPDGSMLLTGGDDKVARLWSTKDWKLLMTSKANKKISATAWSKDGKFCFFADRFGDVFAVAAQPTAAAAAAAASSSGESQLERPANFLLGHLQAILTSLTTTQNGRLLISTDRDGKVRANVLPAHPTQELSIIQSYCMGHTNFVTSTAAVPTSSSSSSTSGAGADVQYVVSGSGDGTVRLWDADGGTCLATYVAAEQPPPLPEDTAGAAAGAPAGSNTAEQQQQQAGESEGGSDGEGSGSSSGEEGGEGGGPTKKRMWYKKRRQQCAAVLSVAVAPCGRYVAVAVEGQQEVQLLQLATHPAGLQLLQRISWPDVVNPSCVMFDPAGRLWAVGGPLKHITTSAHVGVAQQGAGSSEFSLCTESVLPAAVRSTLEQRDEQEEAEMAAVAAAAAAGGVQPEAGYYSTAFKKRVYSAEEVEERKRVRTDRKEGARLKALLQQQEQEQQQQQQEKEQQ